MRNLKRVLALALALVMVIGMMVMGVSAAEYTDADSITADYAEAIEVMSAVGMYEGNEGNFMPGKVLTQAEAAALMARLYLGKTAADNYPATQQLFSDVPVDHWAAGEIEFCAAMGLIVGDGTGKFNPDKELTGVALAKLILVAMGKSAKDAGYVGDNWAANIAKDAYLNGLTIEGVLVSAPVTREMSAQMLFQAVTGDEAFATKYFGLEKTTGVIETVDRKNGAIQMSTATKVDTIENVDVSWTNIGYAAEVWTVATAGAKTRTAITDVEITGESLGVSTNGTAYGVLTNTASPKHLASVDAVNGFKVYYNGDLVAVWGYATAAATTMSYIDVDATDGLTAAGVIGKIGNVGVKVDFVDNDTLGLAESVIVTEYTVATVTGIANGTNTGWNAVVEGTYYLSNATVKKSNLVCDEELAYGDLVTYVEYNKDYYVVKAPSATGKYTQANFDATTRQYVSYVIGEETYVKAAKFLGNANLLDVTKDTIGTTLTVYTDPYGYMLAVEKPVNASNYLYVLVTDHATWVGGTKTNAIVAFADGSVQNVTLSGNQFGKAGEAYSYTVTDGVYTLGNSCAASTTDNLYHTTFASYTNGTANMGGLYINKSTVIVDLTKIDADTGLATVYTGYDEIPSMNEISMHYVAKNGFVVLGFVDDWTAPTSIAYSDFIVYHTNAHYYSDAYYLDVLVDGAVETIALTSEQYRFVCDLGVGIYHFEDNDLWYDAFSEEGVLKNVSWSNGTIVVGGIAYTYADDVNFVTIDITTGKVYNYVMTFGWDGTVAANNVVGAYVEYNQAMTAAETIYVVAGAWADTAKKADGSNAYVISNSWKDMDNDEGTFVRRYMVAAGYITKHIDGDVTAYEYFDVTVNGEVAYEDVLAGTTVTLPTAAAGAAGTGFKVEVDGKESYAAYGSELTITADTALTIGYVKFTVDGIVVPVKANTTVNVADLTLVNEGTYVSNTYTNAGQTAATTNFKAAADGTISAGAIDHAIVSGYYKVTVEDDSQKITVVAGKLVNEDGSDYEVPADGVEAGTYYAKAGTILKQVTNDTSDGDKTYTVEANDVTIATPATTPAT